MDYLSLNHERTKMRFELAAKIMAAISSPKIRTKLLEMVEGLLKKNKSERCECEFCDNLAADLHNELSKHH